MFYLSTEQPKMHETALQMVSMFHTSLVIHGRCKIFLFQHGQTSSSSAMKLEVRLIKPFQRKTQNTVKHSVKKKNFFHRHAKIKVWESEDEKYVMFISSMVLQWIMTFCTYQQKLKNV